MASVMSVAGAPTTTLPATSAMPMAGWLAIGVPPVAVTGSCTQMSFAAAPTITMSLLVPSEPVASRPGSVRVALLLAASLIVPRLRRSELIAA